MFKNVFLWVLYLKFRYFIYLYLYIMKILKKIIKALLLLSLFILPINTFAAWIDHFQVILKPDKVNIWEALDITIKAVDRDNNIVKWYNWSILVFSETDAEADFPNVLKDNSYTFTAADEWVVKFENAVIFNNWWLQNITVYDLNDDTILWVSEINIQKKVVQKNIAINILSPENGLTIWEKTIKISWKSTKNHKIRITVNWTWSIDTTTDSNWIFEINADKLNNWENTIKSEILNADNIVIGTSDTITIKVDSTKPTLKSLKVKPETNINPESKLEVEVIATPWLKEVNIIINDVITKLNETDSKWTYTWELIAPKNAWTYNIDTVLKDDIWHEIKELWSWNIKVNKLELNAPSAIENVFNEVLKDTPSISTPNKDLSIKWLKVVELKTKSVLSWTPIEWVKSYSVYQKMSDGSLELVSTTTQPNFEVASTSNEVQNYTFLVKATAQTASWILHSWDLSRAIQVKTWPAEYILLLLLAMILWFVIVKSSKKA